MSPILVAMINVTNYRLGPEQLEIRYLTSLCKMEAGWNMLSSEMFKVNQGFAGICCLLFQKISQQTLRGYWHLYSKQHVVTIQETIYFVVTNIRT
jgi:hypothetical protein